MSIRLEVNFSPKHQLLENDYHSDGFYQSFYVSIKPDNHLVQFFEVSIFFYLFNFSGDGLAWGSRMSPVCCWFHFAKEVV